MAEKDDPFFFLLDLCYNKSPRDIFLFSASFLNYAMMTSAETLRQLIPSKLKSYIVSYCAEN
jgi:hypothetical protein